MPHSLARAYKSILCVCTLFLALSLPASARQRIDFNCAQGGNTVTTQGNVSTTKVMQSFPSATATIFTTGTLVAATIYSDNAGTPKSNPFTTGTDSHGFYYAENGVRVDIQCSGTGIGTPFTVAADQISDDPSTFTVNAPQVVTFSATPTFDMSTGSWFQMTLTGNVTGPVFSNPVAGDILILTLIQDGTGSRTFSWPAAFLRPPTIASAINATTELTFKYDGTNWRALAATGDNLQVSGSVFSSLYLVGATDTGLSRISAATIAAGNGTAGNASGAFQAQSYTIPSVAIWGTAQLRVGANQNFNFASTNDGAGGSADTGLSRTAAATVGVGNGGNGDVSGTLAAAGLKVAGGTTLTGQTGTGTSIVTNNGPTIAGTTALTAITVSSTTPVANLKVQNCGNTCAITQPTISTGVTSGSGFKHQRFGASCTTGASVGASCNTAVTWTVAFADANYSAVCTVNGITSGVPTQINVNSKTGAGMNISIAALTAVAAQASGFDCIAVHD